MSISSGIGEDVGRSPILPADLKDMTAFVNTARENLGITKDTLQVSFTQLGGQIWKYQGSANRPVLPPLVSTRMQTGILPEMEGPWKEYYEGLLNSLPTVTRQKLDYDSQQPSDQRDPAYAALQGLLVGTAKALALVQVASQPVAPGSVEERYANLNALLPLFTSGATVTQGTAFFNKVRSFLDEMGANYPNTDKLSYTTRQAQYELNNLQQALDTYGKQ